METKTVTDWRTIASIAEKYKTERWIFHGVGDSDYTLIPRIGRPDTSKDINTGNNLGYAADFEQRCMDLFKRESGPL